MFKIYCCQIFVNVPTFVTGWHFYCPKIVLYLYLFLPGVYRPVVVRVVRTVFMSIWFYVTMQIVKISTKVELKEINMLNLSFGIFMKVGTASSFSLSFIYYIFFRVNASFGVLVQNQSEISFSSFSHTNQPFFF